MKKFLKKIAKSVVSSRNSITPLINISLSRSSLLHNLAEFRRIAPKGNVAPVLKSNAYGHGLGLIAEILDKEKVPFLIIDSYFEAQALRNDDIHSPLLIIGYVRPENINISKLKNIVYVITSLDSLREINSKTHIHLKIDTGMSRQGISANEKEEAVKIIKNNPNLIIEGICSHFADADNTDISFTKNQINIWNEMVKYFKYEFADLKYWHISASAGHIYKEADANLTRLGIGLYGLTDIKGLSLKPVLQMKTIITGIKNIKKGDKVGYNGTFIAERDMKLATLALGYFEGIDRRLSNIGMIKYKNTLCPIVGRVSMNITIIDITNISDARIGDEVIVMSNIKSDKNSIENMARDCHTIPYEIVVHIPQQLRRVVID